ncbi:extracellular solute-binding protein, partial [Lactobacillus sp. XV13L]|nr:extracellular solute-binding protein [Lactobacillus sp. XV13L]
FDHEWEGLAKSSGFTFVDSKLKPQFTSKPVKNSAKFIMNMVNKKEALTAGEDLYGDKNFTSGKSIFYVGSSAGIATMKQHAPKSLKWGTMPLPSYKGKKATQFAGNDLVMYKSASKKEKQGAAAFMKYLISTKTTIKWAKMTGYVPVRKSAVESSEYQNFLKKDPTAKAAVDSLPFGFQSTAFVGFSEFRNDLLSTVDNMLTQHKPVNQALKDLQSKTKTIINQK